MPVVNKTLSVPYTADQMQALVADIRRYPDFVPWIKKLRVVDETQMQSQWTGRADAAIGFKSFSERFTTDVVSDTETRDIVVKLVRGPFRKLENHWSFKDHQNGQSEVCFSIDFEFSNPVLALLARANMDFAISQIMSCFLTEADRRYKTQAQGG